MKRLVSQIALRVVAFYLLITAGWFLFFDRLITKLFEDPYILQQINILKDGAYILLTAIVLYIFLNDELRKRSKPVPDANKQNREPRIYDERPPSPENRFEVIDNGLDYQKDKEQIRQQFLRLAALRTIDVAITSNPDLNSTLDVILDQVVSHLKADAAGVLILDEETEMLEYAASRGYGDNHQYHCSLRLGEGLAGRVAQTRKPLILPEICNAQGDDKRLAEIEANGFTAYYALPLISRKKLKGVLEVYRRESIKPNADWMAFFETLSGQTAIAIDHAMLYDHLQQSNVELTAAYNATLEGWSKALELRDRETEGHTQRVAHLTLSLAQKFGIDGEELTHIYRGALLHDIGKMGVPDSILLKPGPLDENEWQIMRLHTEYAYHWLSSIDFLRPALDIPYSHHERWDGSGYPLGLKADDIPLPARLFSVADVWDALRSDRPYRPAWDEADVRQYLKTQAGKHFDPRVVKEFFSILKREPSYQSQLF